MVYLFGASGHGLVVHDILECNDIELYAYVDDNPQASTQNGIWVMHSQDFDPKPGDQMVIGIGVNRNRKRVAKSWLVEYLTAVHPQSAVSKKATLDPGTVVMAGAVVNIGSVVGQHAIINTGACVDHECHLADYVHVAPNATLCGKVTVDEGAYIGAGAVVVQGIRLGKWCTVGAGAVVREDVPDGAVVVGNPARIIRMESEY
jgi:sugar O-acyltransferase (sialic acid O-acetyltransferase NeuD family)